MFAFVQLATQRCAEHVEHVKRKVEGYKGKWIRCEVRWIDSFRTVCLTTSVTCVDMCTVDTVERDVWIARAGRNRGTSRGQQYPCRRGENTRGDALKVK